MGYVFDFCVIVILIGSALIGFWRGFLSELLDFIAVAAGVVFVAVCQHLGIQLFTSIHGSERLGQLLTYVTEFVLAVAVCRVGGSVVRRLMKLTPLRLLDRPAGAVFAAAKSLALLAFMLMTLLRYPVLGTGWIKQSILSPILLFMGRVMISIYPSEFVRTVRETLAGA